LSWRELGYGLEMAFGLPWLPWLPVYRAPDRKASILLWFFALRMSRMAGQGRWN
jgi:hypothetical protein